MSKSRLQELCHQRLWPPPDYTVSHDGPAHYPRFRASVTVNGVKFQSPGVFKSAKGAQNMAAQVAIDHFAANPPLKSSPQNPVLVESQIPYKTQLLIYAQKNNVGLPKYDAVMHAPCFKANVTVNGQTFYGQQFFKTLKEAEGDAAKVALSSLSTGESQNPQNDSTFFKNLLQEMATKEGMSLPKYTTVSTGACHMPIFCSTVEIGGESFVGDAAKTKKQAEMNAANVAWFKLKERLNTNSGRGTLSSGCLMHESLKPASSGSQSKDTRNLELPKSSSISPSHVKLNHSKENPEEDLRSDICDEERIAAENEAPILHDDQGTHSKEIMLNGNGHIDKSDLSLHKEIEANTDVLSEKETSSSMESACNDLGVITDVLSEEETSSSMESACNDLGIVADVNSEMPMGVRTCSMQCNGGWVHPNKPHMVIPGASWLLFSDDKRVAISMDF